MRLISCAETPAYAGIAATILLAMAGAGFVQPALAQHKVHTVVIEAMKFSPDVLEVAAGDTVVWKNRDPFPHNARSVGSGFKSPDIAPNHSWKFKARKKGAFAYVCTLHPTMKATLIVK